MTLVRATRRRIALHVYPNTLEFESRMLRISAALTEAGLFDEIILVGLAAGDLPATERVDAHRRIVRLGGRLSERSKIGRLLQFAALYLGVIRLAFAERPECINPHSLTTLPLAGLVRLLTGCRLVYDTHELETESVTLHGVRKRIFKVIERMFIGLADLVIVVSEPIADWYRRAYPKANIVVIRNLPMARRPDKVARRLRSRFNIHDDDFVFLYQGLLNTNRNLDLIFDVFRRAPSDRHLVVMGYGPAVEQAMRAAAECANIHYCEAVPPAEVVPYAAEADVGLALVEPSVCLSHEYALTNKLLTTLTAGVAAISNSTTVIDDLARTSEAIFLTELTTESMLGLVTTISREEVAIHGAGARAWGSRNSWQNEKKLLCDAYRAFVDLERDDFAVTKPETRVEGGTP